MNAAFLVGAQYFTLNQQVYAFHEGARSISPIDSTLVPLISRPIIRMPPLDTTTVLDGFTLRNNRGSGLELWVASLRRWERVELFRTYGDAISANSPCIRGIKLQRDQGEIEEELFYSYGRPPTWESVNQWVKDRRASQAPLVCPLKDCKKNMRRPNILKDHLFFKFQIKTMECPLADCGRLFVTKYDLVKHMEHCGVSDIQVGIGSPGSSSGSENIMPMASMSTHPDPRDRPEAEREPALTTQFGSTLESPGLKHGAPIETVQPSSAWSAQSVRSNEIVPSEMLKYLIAHGCSDLKSSIDSSCFSTCRVAEGSFGDVWKGRLIDGTNIAVKVLRYALVCNNDPKSVKRIMREIYNWSKLDHKNIHKLLGVTIFEGRLGMVSKWMENGTLKQYLQRRNDVNRHALCIGIVEGVVYLHSVNMIHGDLKACNILLSLDGVPKLTDFDHSIFSDPSLQFSNTTRIGGGTLRWMAPELVIEEETQEKTKYTDVYALGMTLLEVVTNAVPYPECRGDPQVMLKLLSKKLPKRPVEHFPESAHGNQMWSFFTRCWNHDPMTRPPANSILESLSNLKF